MLPFLLIPFNCIFENVPPLIPSMSRRPWLRFLCEFYSEIILKRWMMYEYVTFLRLNNVRMAAAQPLKITHDLDDCEMRPNDIDNGDIRNKVRSINGACLMVRDLLIYLLFHLRRIRHPHKVLAPRFSSSAALFRACPKNCNIGLETYHIGPPLSSSRFPLIEYTALFVSIFK